MLHETRLARNINFSAFDVITRKVYYFKPVIIIPSCLTLMEFFFKGTRALFRELDNIELGLP